MCCRQGQAAVETSINIVFTPVYMLSWVDIHHMAIVPMEATNSVVDVVELRANALVNELPAICDTASMSICREH